NKAREETGDEPFAAERKKSLAVTRHRPRHVEGNVHKSASRQESVNVDRRRFMLRLALVLAADLDARDAPEVVVGVLARSIDQQVFLLVDEVLPMKVAHLEIRRELDRIRRAGFLAKPAKDAAGEIDPEEFRIAAAGLVFGRLERDAVHRAGDRAEVAGHTAFAPIGIPRQNDPAPVARREVGLLLGILNGDAPLKRVEKDVPDGPK